MKYIILTIFLLFFSCNNPRMYKGIKYGTIDGSNPDKDTMGFVTHRTFHKGDLVRVDNYIILITSDSSKEIK